MKEFRVKYTRKEYREEYLQSDEWKTLRDTILVGAPNCQICKNVEATDVHHLVYRNIVDVKITDLLPVCRSCHEFVHQAITDGYISQDPEKIERITILTLNILSDEKYKAYRDWLESKHYLSDDEIKQIRKITDVIKRIQGLIKKTIWLDELPNYKFTGRQILKIRQFIKLVRYKHGKLYKRIRYGQPREFIKL